MRKTHRHQVGDKVVVKYYSGINDYWHETTIKALTFGVYPGSARATDIYPAYRVDVPRAYSHDLVEVTVLDLKSHIRTVEEHEAMRQARAQRIATKDNAKWDAEQQRRNARRLEVANAITQAITKEIAFSSPLTPTGIDHLTAIIAEALKGYM